MIIENVKIVNHNKTIENADIEVKNGLIANITPKEGKAKLIAIPGFIDSHIHGFGGFDVMDSQQAAENVSLSLVKGGVTSFLPTIMTASIEKLESSIKHVTSAKYDGAKFAGIHMEGPFFGEAKKGAQNPKYLIDGDAKLVEQFQKLANGSIRKISFDPTRVEKDVIGKMIELNIIPTVGHTNATYDEAMKAYEEGAMSATHLWNGMSGVQNRQPGTVQASLVHKGSYAELICDLVHVDEASIKLSTKAKGVDKITVITDSIAPGGLEDGEYASGGLPVIKKGPEIRLKDSGNIAGSGATMIMNFQNLIKLGYPMQDVVAMTSKNIANNLSFNKLGEISKGFNADIVLLNEDLTINKVFIDGEVKA